MCFCFSKLLKSSSEFWWIKHPKPEFIEVPFTTIWTAKPSKNNAYYHTEVGRLKSLEDRRTPTPIIVIGVGRLDLGCSMTYDYIPRRTALIMDHDSNLSWAAKILGKQCLKSLEKNA